MIKNEKQHKIANAKLNKWLKTQAQLRDTTIVKTDWLAKEQAFGVQQQIKQLRAEITEYEQTAAGKRKLPELELVFEIPSMLIRWRIARHLTQRELAKRAGIHENQLQKYEAEHYGCASYQTIAHIAQVLQER
jgi:HTH-type transcriptional regulator / antitoxin HigA